MLLSWTRKTDFDGSVIMIYRWTICSVVFQKKRNPSTENLILEYLSKGKYPQKELVKKAQAIGISKRVLDEAKKALNVQSVKEGSQWYWQLPEKTE